MIRQQGGDVRIIEEPGLLPQAAYVLPVISSKSGYVRSINSQQIGYALVETGAGRMRLDDDLDMAAGAFLPYKTGDRIEKGMEISRIYCNDPEKGKKAGERVKTAYEIIAEKVEKEAVILE
jgi:pyrimidine-nucleoside phosphorylase